MLNLFSGKSTCHSTLAAHRHHPSSPRYCWSGWAQVIPQPISGHVCEHSNFSSGTRKIEKSNYFTRPAAFINCVRGAHARGNRAGGNHLQRRSLCNCARVAFLQRRCVRAGVLGERQTARCLFGLLVLIKVHRLFGEVRGGEIDCYI